MSTTTVDPEVAQLEAELAAGHDLLLSEKEAESLSPSGRFRRSLEEAQALPQWHGRCNPTQWGRRRAKNKVAKASRKLNRPK